MDKKLVKELLRQIEKTYRRGFQHGYTFAMHSPNPPTELQVYNYRYKKSLNKAYTAPEQPKWKYHELTTVFERLEMEADGDAKGRELVRYLEDSLKGDK